MRRGLHLAALLLAVPCAGQEAAPARWRASRHVVQRLAEEQGFRWAMPATGSRRAYLRELSEAELCRQTGLTVETLNGVRVYHVPREEERKALAKDGRATALGWLRDARAWPLLARMAAADDPALALAAAQALRRMEGDKDLDWRLFGVSDSDPEFVPMGQPVAPWQAPLGLAFPDSVPFEAVERLSRSTYVPLREAAARLATGAGDRGKALVERLAADPAPLVSRAARRASQAWAVPARGKPAARKPDEKAWHLKPLDFAAATEKIRAAKEHDTVWRLEGRRVGYEGTPEAIKVLTEYGTSKAQWSTMATIPLAEFCGGEETVAFLKRAAANTETYSSKQGWAIWGLSALLDGPEFAAAVTPALEKDGAYWASPPEYTAARWAGVHVLKPLLARLEKRGHWACLALGHVGGPDAVEALVKRLDHPDAGVASAAARGLGDAGALAGLAPLVAQLKHADRLRRHWAVLALGRIGGPDASKALAALLADEKDRMVRKAAIVLLSEIDPGDAEAKRRLAAFEEEDRKLVPEYRPRNARFDENFPVNTEVETKALAPRTYCSTGETRVAMDWANRLLVRYGGCTGSYSNEFFALDVGTETWFPIRAADQYEFLFDEVRPNPG